MTEAAQNNTGKVDSSHSIVSHKNSKTNNPAPDCQCASCSCINCGDLSHINAYGLDVPCNSEYSNEDEVATPLKVQVVPQLSQPLLNCACSFCLCYNCSKNVCTKFCKKELKTQDVKSVETETGETEISDNCIVEVKNADAQTKTTQSVATSSEDCKIVNPRVVSVMKPECNCLRCLCRFIQNNSQIPWNPPQALPFNALSLLGRQNRELKIALMVAASFHFEKSSSTDSLNQKLCSSNSTTSAQKTIKSTKNSSNDECICENCVCALQRYIEETDENEFDDD